MPSENEKRLTDADLRDLLAKNIPQTQIAKLYHVSPQYISKRVKGLDRKAAAQSPAAAESAASTMWQARTAAQENYAGLLAMLSRDLSAREEIQVRAEIRAHIAFGVQSLDALYSVEDAAAFQEEVLKVLDDSQPGKRQEILEKLRQVRPLRDAFAEPAL